MVCPLLSLGWEMLVSKVDLVGNDEGTVIAEGRNNDRFEYDNYLALPKGEGADAWIWGMALTD